MVFDSILFLYTFLPISLVLFWVLPKRLKPAGLLVCNLFFWIFSGLWAVPFILISPLFDYFLGRKLEGIASTGRRKKAAWCGLGVYVLVLAAWLMPKWANIESGLSLFLPLGIVCWIMRSSAYLLDIASGEIQAETSFFRYFTYQTCFFFHPASPVAPYQKDGRGLFSGKNSADQLSEGLRGTIRGVSKAALLGGSLMSFCTACFQEKTTFALWIGLAAFGMGLYFLFSGFSDMSTGIAAMFGLSLPQNFRHPLGSENIGQFLARWEQSVSDWLFRYLPFGKRNSTRGILFLLLWSLFGLWHGSGWNLLLWGLYLGLLLWMEQALRSPLSRLPKWVRILLTNLLLIPGWLLFSQNSFSSMLDCLKGLAGMGTAGLWSRQTAFLLLNNGVIFLLGIFFASPCPGIWIKKLEQTPGRAVPILISLGYLLLLLLSTAFLVGTEPPAVFTL